MLRTAFGRIGTDKPSSRPRWLRPHLEHLEDRVTPSLTIVKSVTDFDVIRPGDTASFTITVTNDGPDPATDVVVTDQLPAAELLTWQVSSSLFGTTSMSTGDFLTANLSALPAHATVFVTVSAVIPLDFFGSPFPVPPEARLPGGPFELDGNAMDDSAVTGNDWANAVFGDGGSSLARTFVTDAVDSRSDDIFTGRGSRDTDGIQEGPWRFTDSKPQAKYDIAHAFAAMYVDPNNGHLILYAGLDRYDSGAAGAGFWFFKNPVGTGTGQPGKSGSPFAGTHTDGDILLVSDFAQGASSMQVFRWVGDDATGSLQAVATPPGTAFAIVNGAPVTVPWPFTNKSHESGPAAGEFLEVGVDLTALGLGSRFTTYLAETRSSQSPTPTLTDFVIGSFNTSRLDLVNTATLSADGIDPIRSNTVVISILSQDEPSLGAVGSSANFLPGPQLLPEGRSGAANDPPSANEGVGVIAPRCPPGRYDGAGFHHGLDRDSSVVEEKKDTPVWNRVDLNENGLELDWDVLTPLEV